MSGDPRDDRPDPALAEALARIPVPPYEPGFWDRLEDRLQEPGSTTVVPLARRREAGPRGRRGAVLVAAAAAVLVALVAVQLVRDDDDQVRVASPLTSSTVPISTLSGAHVPASLAGNGTDATPQDAFAAWVDALDREDYAAANALVGPRTVAYYDALGPGIDGIGAGWERWADSPDRRLDVIDFGEVQGEHVAGLLIEGTADPTVEGTPDAEVDRDALILVEGDDGWLVEPAAFDPDGESRLDVLTPESGEHGLGPLDAEGPVRIAVPDDGVYYVGVDQGRLAGFTSGDAEDGVVTWRPAEPLAPGKHLLVIAHLSPKVLLLNSFVVTVPEPAAP